MAIEFIPLSDNDTKELRKEIGLPVTKGLVYWCKNESHKWEQFTVSDYEVVAVYEPSGGKSLMVTLENGRQVRIYGDYFAEMQKPNFLGEVDGEESDTEGEDDDKPVTGKRGSKLDNITDDYIVIDLETTGVNHLRDEIIQIGAIKYVAGKEVDRLDLYVKTDVKIPKSVEKLTGISNDMLMLLGVEPKKALLELKEFLADNVVVGHNIASFDSKFLEDAYVKYLCIHFPNDYVDTLNLAKKLLPNLEHHSLEHLSEYYGIDYSKAHSAVEDCLINQSVIEKMVCNNDSDHEKEADSSLKEDSSDLNGEETYEVETFDNWMKKLESVFPKLESEFGLPENSFRIREGRGKDGQISSYPVCVYEPDLVETARDDSRYTTLARVKVLDLKTQPNAVDVYSSNFESGEEKQRHDKESDDMILCLIECIKKGLCNYSPKAASFACCSRYEECSNAKKCIHPNVLYAKACQYRKNLENGEVFY